MWVKCEWNGCLFVLARRRMLCHAGCVFDRENTVIFPSLLHYFGHCGTATANFYWLPTSRVQAITCLIPLFTVLVSVRGSEVMLDGFQPSQNNFT